MKSAERMPLAASTRERRRALLHEHALRNHEQTAADGDAEQVERDPKAPARQQERLESNESVHRDRLVTEARKEKVQQEHAQSHRTRCHEPALQSMPRETPAGKRADANADAEQHEKERDHLFIDVEDLLPVSGEEGEQRGAKEPKPRHA